MFVPSWYGDGAIVDLCRLTIERFQQTRILQDFLGSEVLTLELTSECSLADQAV